DRNGDAFRDMRDRMRNASEEERQALFAEMQTAMQERQKQREEQVKQILDEKQYTRLSQLSLQRAGVSALAREDVAESLGLSEDQRTEMTSLGEDYRSKMMELGFRASEEDRQRVREEFEGKFLGVLRADQKTAWTAKLGEPAAYDLNSFGRRDGERGPPQGGGPGGPPQAGAPPRPPVQQPQIVMAPPDGATVVSSFGAPAGEAAARGQEAADFSFNFRYAPWVEVLKLFADRAGLTLDLNTVPPGTFNYYDDGAYTITQALDIINGYLIPKGYILVRRDRFLVCVNVDTTIPPSIVPNVDKAELYQRGNNELMTVVFPVEGANIDDVVKEVGQLVGPQGKPVGLKSTNSIVVTDIGSNLRRIDELLRQISAGPESTVFKSYPLQFVAADEAEATVRALLGLQVGVTDVSAGNTGDRGNFDPRDPRTWGRDRESSRSSSNSSSSTTATQARLYAELRTNSLMVTATPAQQKIVEETLKVIDVDEEATGAYARGRRPYLQVYEVKSSDPREVVKTLSVLVPGVVVNEDGRNGKLHIVATESQHQEVALLVRQLDGLGAGEQVAVIPLVRMDPVTASITLRSMFVRDGEDAPTIEPDLYGRQLMIRGNSTQLAQAQQLLTQLGEDGTGQRRGGDSIMSTFPLSGRDPSELLPLLERAWGNTSSSPVRIVRPKERGPVQDVRTPGSSLPSSDVDVDLQGPSARVSPSHPQHGSRQVPVHLAVQTETRSPDAAAPPAGQPAPRLSDDELDNFIDLLDGPAAEPETSPKPTVKPTEPTTSPPLTEDAPPPTERKPVDPAAPITITVLGDDLLISSPDPAVRAQMEEMLEDLMQAVPPRTSWTIFPLEYADVTTTAATLEQLFPDSEVTSADSLGGGGMFGGLTSGISSMTSSLSSISGLSSTAGATLRIIPYIPDNSLFVSGPAYKVREVEEMLQILDSGELSASLRERTPRMIPVRYADIDEVYTIVKDIYKDSLESEQDRGARNAANMFAQMMGGGGRRGGEGGQSSPAAALSLGIDRQTSQLIVASSESKFQEIKALVEQVDASALEARRTVKVVTLRNTSTAQLQNTVSSLMPRVKVSSTASRGTSSSGSNSSSTPSSSGGGENRPDPEAFRRMMEERMRSMQGGGGDRGGGDAGRPSFRGFGGDGGRPSSGSPFSGGFRGFGGDRGGSRGGR
ncbi:MAG: hypothetical protein KDA75_14040, partial [Planctomycetaceae bacterium]|nr:hypothetical protein [Planctomycetaceae bacterium]